MDYAEHELIKITNDKFKEIMTFHMLWLDNEPSGKKAQFDNIDFSDIKNSEDDLSYDYVIFNNCIINTSQLIGRFNKAEFNNCTFISEHRHSSMTNSSFTNAKFNECIFENSIVEINNCTFSGASFWGCEMNKEFTFYNCVMDSCTYEYCHLEGINFNDCLIKYSLFTECDMSNVFFLGMKIGDIELSKCKTYHMKATDCEEIECIEKYL